MHLVIERHDNNAPSNMSVVWWLRCRTRQRRDIKSIYPVGASLSYTTATRHQIYPSCSVCPIVGLVHPIIERHDNNAPSNLSVLRGLRSLTRQHRAIKSIRRALSDPSLVLCTPSLNDTTMTRHQIYSSCGGFVLVHANDAQ